MSIIDYLDSKGIEYKTKGKNISSGWVGIETCPSCLDSGFHFGINSKELNYSCWVCGEKGGPVNLFRLLEKCGYKRAKMLVEQYFPTDILDDDEPEPIIKKKINGNILPKECSDFLYDQHINYLLGRNFNPNYLTQKYNLKSCLNTGQYKFSIIAPVIMDGETVSFIAADTTGKAKAKYLFPPNAQVHLPIHSCLYNIDSVKNGEVIIVEGITDVWRLGDGAVATMGKRITKEQINLLLKKDIERVVVIPDSDAHEAGEKIANQVSGFFDNVEMIPLDEGDPGDLNADEVSELRRYIGF